MNLLQEKIIEIKDKLYSVILTNRALYKTQIELNKSGLLELLQSLDKMDLETVYTLLAHCINGKVKKDDLIDADINLVEITTHLAASLGCLFEKKEGKVPEKK